MNSMESRFERLENAVGLRSDVGESSEALSRQEGVNVVMDVLSPARSPRKSPFKGLKCVADAKRALKREGGVEELKTPPKRVKISRENEKEEGLISGTLAESAASSFGGRGEGYPVTPQVSVVTYHAPQDNNDNNMANNNNNIIVPQISPSVSDVSVRGARSCSLMAGTGGTYPCGVGRLCGRLHLRSIFLNIRVCGCRGRGSSSEVSCFDCQPPVGSRSNRARFEYRCLRSACLLFFCS